MNFIKLNSKQNLFKHMSTNSSITAAPTAVATTKTISKNKGPIEEAIHCVLKEEFEPLHLEVINESYMHNVPKGAETHFKVLIVSDKFESLPLIKRHRLVNAAVKGKLSGNFVHALAIEAKTSKQWQQGDILESSPKCLGGFGK